MILERECMIGECTWERGAKTTSSAAMIAVSPVLTKMGTVVLLSLWLWLAIVRRVVR